MEGLRKIASEMGDEFEGIRTSDIGAVVKLVGFGLSDAIAEDHALVRDCRHNATALCAIAVEVCVADRWRGVERVDPMPLVSVRTLCRLSVGICPCRRAPN